MAYSSFRLRRTDLVASPDSNPFGSYVRADATTAPSGQTRTDADYALRADSFAYVAVTTLDTITFSATAVNYTDISLSWTPFTLTNKTLNADGVTNPFEVVVVYSTTGFPETVADGTIIKTQPYTDLDFSVLHTLPEAHQGTWAYYSLFVHWNQSGVGVTGTTWYERMATLQELSPKDYGSYNQLWSRIPSQYRTADTFGSNLDPSGLGRGQLSRFLSIFSFEIDKSRTLINKVMTQYDPQSNESQSIDALSEMFALEVSAKDIGTSRIRQLLQDIGYYRQQKGTINSIKQYITAISGCKVDVVESPISPKYTFRVYAEKANLVADSLFVITNAGTKKWEFSSSSASCTFTKSAENLLVTNTSSASVQFALTSLVAVPVASDVEYWSSAKVLGSGVTHGSQWSASASWGTWNTASQLSTAGVSSTLSPANRKVIKMPVQSTTVSRYPVMLFSLQAGQSTTVSQWMVEPGRYGEFFNGSSDFGGFVYGETYPDNSWSGSAYASYSLYSTNKKKTQNAITKLLPLLLPVTMLLDTNIDYALVFDWIPGKT